MDGQVCLDLCFNEQPYAAKSVRVQSVQKDIQTVSVTLHIDPSFNSAVPFPGITHRYPPVPITTLRDYYKFGHLKSLNCTVLQLCKAEVQNTQLLLGSKHCVG